MRFHHVKTNLCKTSASVSNYGLGTFGRAPGPWPPGPLAPGPWPLARPPAQLPCPGPALPGRWPLASRKPTPPLHRNIPVKQSPVLSSSRGSRHRPSSVRGVLSPCPERERSLRPSRRSSPNHPGLANSRKPQSFQSNACKGLRVVLGSFEVKPL